MQKIDAAYRESEEYLGFMAGIRAINPELPVALAEMAIAAYLADPTAHKRVKRKGYVPPPPPPSPESFEIHSVSVEPPSAEESPDNTTTTTIVTEEECLPSPSESP